jgi:hypothetical protein
MTRFVNPRPQFFDSSGDVLSGGKLYVYDSGTTTPKTTYVDVNQSTANANPIILDADGRVPSVFFDGTARVVLRDADDVLVWDIDPVSGTNLTGPFSEWSPEITYDMGSFVVTSDGELYRSLTAANADNEPSTSPEDWEQLEFLTIWNEFVTYAINATVKGSDGQFYKSLVNGNLGNDPTTDSVNWGAPVDVFVLGVADGGVKTSGFTAGVNTRYVARFSSAQTITLPPTPSQGDVVVLTIASAFVTTLDRNGSLINATAANFPLGPGYYTDTYTYDATAGWC